MGACCSQKKPLSLSPSQPQPSQSDPEDSLARFMESLFPPNSPSTLPEVLTSLKDHLEAHPEDVKRCLTELRNKAKAALTSLSEDDLRVLRVLVKAADTLMSLEPLQIMALVYEVAGKCVGRPAFLQLRSDLYETLERSSPGDFEEVGLISGPFLAGLIQFCRQYPDQVTPRDIGQLQQLVGTASSSTPLETRTQRWEELMTLLWERLKQDATGVDSALIQAEKQLLMTLYKETVTSDKSAQLLFCRLLGVIDSCTGWGSYSAATLSVLLETVATTQPRLSSQLLRQLLTTLPSRIAKGKLEEVRTINAHVTAFLKAVKEQVATLTYTPTLLSIFLALFSLSELHDSASVLLTQWSRRTDIQSCIRLLSELSQQHTAQAQARLCLSRLKSCIRPRILKDWDTHIFCENWNQLLAEVINKAARNGSLLTLHVADFVVNVLGEEIRIRVNEVAVLSKIALGCLETLNGEITANWLKACKYSSQIWQNLASQQTAILQNGLLKVVRKLQGLAEQTERSSVQVSLVVLLLVLAHNVGKYYDLPNLVQFACQSGTDLAAFGLYPRLFKLNLWEELYDSPSFLFHKADLSLFRTITSRVFISPAPLRLPIFDSSLSREGTLALLRENLDPLEALQSERSYSDFSPVNTGDVKMGFKEVKAESGTTGVESAIR